MGKVGKGRLKIPPPLSFVTHSQGPTRQRKLLSLTFLQKFFGQSSFITHNVNEKEEEKSGSFFSYDAYVWLNVHTEKYMEARGQIKLWQTKVKK